MGFSAAFEKLAHITMKKTTKHTLFFSMFEKLRRRRRRRRIMQVRSVLKSRDGNQTFRGRQPNVSFYF
ncbi:hypothetical protein Hanom_Chr16g01511811 [Helianthus anomalus]